MTVAPATSQTAQSSQLSSNGPTPTSALPDAGIDPASAALLVMDLQAGILARLPDADTFLARCAAAVEVARSAGMTVGHVRVAFTPGDYDNVPSTSRMVARVASSGGAFDDDSPLTAFPATVAPIPGDIVVRKTRVSAFSTTDLAVQLRERAITTLVLAGLSTSGVVLSTVRDASDRDFSLYVLADACADPEPATHKFLIETLLPRQATVITIAELTGLLDTT